jgi:hypothetical protein
MPQTSKKLSEVDNLLRKVRAENCRLMYFHVR